MLRTKPTRRIHRLACVLPALLATATPTFAEDNKPVFVVNLPEVQEIEGSVRIADPAPHARLGRIQEEVVSPVDPEDTTSLVLAGYLESSGFVSTVLSLTGQIRSNHFLPGRVGALLIPDEPLIRHSFTEGGQTLFPLRVEAEVQDDGSLYFSSDQPLRRLAFPRYRVYFYNTTDRPAAVTLYAYLTN